MYYFYITITSGNCMHYNTLWMWYNCVFRLLLAIPMPQRGLNFWSLCTLCVLQHTKSWSDCKDVMMGLWCLMNITLKGRFGNFGPIYNFSLTDHIDCHQENYYPRQLRFKQCASDVSPSCCMLMISNQVWSNCTKMPFVDFEEEIRVVIYATVVTNSNC